ncbi:SpoIIE family protein phosphatase [Adhaeretor mobilis]|uniref:Phosphoserine phosphatase RsbU n=1 Tax=Adhaeretor mobilis TaxID=1930276 RepID=A0A517MZJ1_9BACT|nr:SpoIIE family protein phosphatase [Adhaeretor mobilis]QDT00218.1 Phosphoserine phosphatase RsbU [Adhaeretor mobilis]
MSSLTIIQGGEVGRMFELKEGESSVGRSPESDVVVDVAAVSRRHAVIEKNGGRVQVRDLGSRNGTYVNGSRVIERAELREGDQMVICDVVFVYGRSADDANKRTYTGSLLSPAPIADDNQGSSVLATLDVSRGASSAWQVSAKPETQLQAILEISSNLSNTLDVREILPRVLDSLFKIFPQADRGFVIRRPDPEGPLATVASKARRGDGSTDMHISNTVVEQAMQSQQALLSADAASDERFSMAQSIADFSIRSLLCAPMVSSEGESLGVIQIDTRDQRSRFTDQDLQVLAGVANQAAISIDNAQMHEVAIKQRALQRDLEVAHQMQQALLPTSSPDAPGYHFFQYYESALQVGGDYYDYVQLPEGRFAAVVGDVAGKGVSAAILMAKLSSDVRFWLASEEDPAKALCKINEAFSRHGWDDRFVTMLVAVVDLATNELTLVNAGHMPPMLRDATGKVQEVGGDQAGVPLGVIDDFEFDSYKRTLESGDFLTIFTDGFSEAMNSRRDLFGIERLQEALEDSSVASDDLGPHLLKKVREFAGDFPQSDDMCLVCLGRE